MKKILTIILILTITSAVFAAGVTRETERRAIGRTVPIPSGLTLNHEARLAMHGIPLPGGSDPTPESDRTNRRGRYSDTYR